MQHKHLPQSKEFHRSRTLPTPHYVGMFGQYGEWYVIPQGYAQILGNPTPATDASKKEFAKMHFDALPNRQHVMLALYGNTNTLSYGLLEQTITGKPVGLRTDCLSKDKFLYNQWLSSPAKVAAWNLFKDQWKKAPFVAEFCTFDTLATTDEPNIARQQVAEFHISDIGNGNFASWASLTPQQQADMLMLGREAGYRYNVDSSSVSVTSAGQLSVTATVGNLGNAPTYEPWSVGVELVNTAGTVAWSGQLLLNLGSIAGQGSTQAVQGIWNLPALAAGNYTVRLAARDSRTPTATTANRPMLKWVNSTVNIDGSLNIASLVNN
jgi:Domain of unknown function (DUF4832)